VYVVPYGMTLAWSTYYFFRQDALLAGTLLILLVTLAVLLYWAPRGCTAAAVGREHAVQAVHEGADDLIRNLASVYGAGTADDEVARLGRAGDAYRVRNEDAMRCLLRYKAVGVPLIVSFVAAVVVRCNHLVRTGRMRTGSFVSLFMITTTMIGTLTWLVSLIRDTTLDSGIIISFGPGVARPQRNGGASGEGGSAHLMAVGDAPLRAVGVSYAPALVDVDVAFEEGERTALVGPVGSGKSTLLRLIAGLVRPQAGELFLAGRPYSQIGLKAVRRIVGYMPQEAVLFDRTVGENLLYGAKATRGQDPGAVVRFARWLGLWEHLEPGLPEGLSTRVGKNGSMLSGGQRQIVWFLRIAFRGPPVLLLDEPTASMDETTRLALIAAIAKLLDAAGGRMTVVMATHDAGLMAFATRTVRINR
jgi:ABC-type multidrug transport system fused ATPase/permease subunit